MGAAYLHNRFAATRRQTLAVRIGNTYVGGEHPILVQSMTTTDTKDIDATAFQVLELANAGCELVRITAPTLKDAECLKDIMAKVRAAGCQVPVSADIHFQPRAAYESVKWVEKVRINPGNFVDSKSAKIRQYDESTFARGREKVFEAFSPLVREAKERGVALRIGTNHGSLSDRMMWKYGDTVEGMIESALEYLAVCEAENFDQIVFSMKSSNPRVAVQAYRLLASRLSEGHKAYPFHIGVTEAGDGEDGRLKSAVGIGAMLLDGMGDTVRVSLTENPVREIPVAKALIALCQCVTDGGLQSNNKRNDYIDSTGKIENLVESLDFYHYQRRETKLQSIGSLSIGGREVIPVGMGLSPLQKLPKIKGDRQPEWLSIHKSDQAGDTTQSITPTQTQIENASVVKVPLPTIQEIAWEARAISSPAGDSVLPSLDAQALIDGKSDFPKRAEIRISELSQLPKLSTLALDSAMQLWWSYTGEENPVAAYRYLAAWLASQHRPDPIILRSICVGDEESKMRSAAEMGALLVDGIGDLIVIQGTISEESGLSLGYDILQAAAVRRSKTEYVACPSCGRTLFDLETTTQMIRSRTSHLKNVSIAIMGCIVNGPGEMADADFGYVGGAPKHVNLYVGREMVRRNIPETQAADELVNLIREHGRWLEPPMEAALVHETF